jgi:glycosyltransferase involved in cell wall biosynthesis
LADWFRGKELVSEEQIIKVIYKFLKNSVQTIGRCFRYIEKKRKISADYFNLNNNDIYFSTYNKIPVQVPFLANLQNVIIIHDLLPVLNPEYFFDLENKIIFETTLNSISKNDKVICVSESTKHDFFKIQSSFNLDNVFVSYLAGATCFKPNLCKKQEEKVKEKYNIPCHKPYFLSVCTLEPRKNIGLLISAYERLLKTLHENELPLLVLIGEVGWKVQTLFDKINRINTIFPNSIILTGFVTDEELSVFYSFTSAFVYPSFYEGFGLPPLEAMQCGAPVITSNKSSLPEVVGNAGILIDPNDEEALLQALKLCLGKGEVKNMRKKSLQRAALFSWDITVNNIVGILQKA